MGIKLPAPLQGSGSAARLKPHAIEAAGSQYVHRVLYELDTCDSYLYEFTSNSVPA